MLRRKHQPGEDEVQTWRAGCIERCPSGSERGSWKRPLMVHVRGARWLSTLYRASEVRVLSAPLTRINPLQKPKRPLTSSQKQLAKRAFWPVFCPNRMSETPIFHSVFQVNRALEPTEHQGLDAVFSGNPDAISLL